MQATSWQPTVPAKGLRHRDLGLVLAVEAAFAAWTLWRLFGHRYAIVDDAREHVVWMSRFLDPGRFAGDPITDYFSGLASTGFVGVYWVLSWIADPVTISKCLPVPLGLASVLAFYKLGERLFDSPRAVIAATCLFTIQLHVNHDLSSAVARSFFFPLFLWFLWALVARGPRSPHVFASLAAQALTYPTAAVIACGVLAASFVPGLRWRPFTRADAALSGAAIVLAALLVGMAEPSAAVGPPITGAEAVAHPAFLEGGRLEFFVSDPVQKYLTSKRSGFGVRGIHPALYVLPLALLASRPMRRMLTRRAVHLVIGVSLVSVAGFVAAHAWLFTLYAPNRFVRFTIPIVLSILSGPALARGLEQAGRRWTYGRAAGTAALLVAALAHLPLAPPGLVVGHAATVYEFLRAQPTGTLLAAFPPEADNLPAFTGHPVVANDVTLLAWHPRYYATMSGRMRDLLVAHYTDSPDVLARFVERYGVTHFVVDRRAFDVEGLSALHEPFRAEAARLRRESKGPILADLATRARVVQDGVAVLTRDEILRAAAPEGERR